MNWELMQVENDLTVLQFEYNGTNSMCAFIGDVWYIFQDIGETFELFQNYRDSEV